MLLSKNIIRFTVCKGEVPATKKLRRRNGAIEKTSYGKGATYWLFSDLRARDLPALARHLRRLMSDPYTMLVYGVPRAGLDLTKKHRRWSSKKRIADGTHTLETTEVCCFVIDCDGFIAEAGMGWGDMLDKSAAYVLNRLPPALAGCRALVIPSSSTGFKRDGRAVNFRAFNMLDRPYPLADLYRWARGARAAGFSMIDPRVLLPGQPIFIARPILVGLKDPVPPHLQCFIIEGRDAATIDLEEYQPQLDRHETEIREYIATGDQQGWRAVLKSTLGAPAYGFFEALQLSLGIAARSGDEADDIVDFCVALLAKRADADRIAHYDEAWLQAAVDAFRSSDNNAHQRTRVIYERLLTNPTKFGPGE